jgi:hypothetical protein
MMARLGGIILFAMLLAVSGGPSSAAKIANNIAVFAALDKVTARVSKLEISIDQTTIFGALKITPRACYTRPPTERPRTSVFVEIDEIQLDGTEERVFTGWMFAESPGVHGLEHPVFDVWLTNCKMPEGEQPSESR